MLFKNQIADNHNDHDNSCLSFVDVDLFVSLDCLVMNTNNKHFVNQVDVVRQDI